MTNGPLIYVGTWRLKYADRLPRSMLSANTLEHRRKPFEARRWIMDSGAFTRITSGRGHMPVADYARLIERWRSTGTLEAAVVQDYMCEPFVMRATGLGVLQHQRLTTRAYLDLRERTDVYVMPVLQGYTPAQYARHTREMSRYIPERAWTGVGSVCKRNGKPEEISAVLTAILRERPDLRVHGFGIKSTALRRGDIWSRFWSVDSMAWSYAARRQGRDGNSLDEAAAWAEKVEAIPFVESQGALDL